MEAFKNWNFDGNLDERRKKCSGNWLSAALLCLVESSNSIAGLEVELQRHTLQDVDPEVVVTAIPTLWCCIFKNHNIVPCAEEGHRCATELKVVFRCAVWELVKAPTTLHSTATISRQRRSVLLSSDVHSVGPGGADTGGHYLRQVPLLGFNEPISWFKKLLQLN